MLTPIILMGLAASLAGLSLAARSPQGSRAAASSPPPATRRAAPETTTPPTQAAGLTGGQPRDQPPQELLARTIWGEARGEPYEGMLAVGEVILNRTNTNYFSDGTIAGTILRKWQFSAWLASDPNRALMLAATFGTTRFLQAWTAAGEVLEGRRVLGAEDWRHYYNPKAASPSWATDFTERRVIGNHVFLRGTH